MKKGSKMSEESRLKMSLAHKGKKHTEETKEKIKNSNTGKVFTEERKLKIGKANKGKLSGDKNPAWVGGRILRNDGYILVFKPEHPHANPCGYVLEHRLVMEKILGRYLKFEEVIHHKNNNHSDNREENLELFESNAVHVRHHKTLALA